MPDESKKNLVEELQKILANKDTEVVEITDSPDLSGPISEIVEKLKASCAGSEDPKLVLETSAEYENAVMKVFEIAIESHFREHSSAPDSTEALGMARSADRIARVFTRSQYGSANQSMIDSGFSPGVQPRQLRDAGSKSSEAGMN